ncbi:MAG: OmpA family protein [Pseudomonadota bacterium]
MALADAYRRTKGRMPSAPARQTGNWKLAYADFLTALVALFLVLWLVNDVPEDSRSGLAGYFRGDEDVAASPAFDASAPPSALLADRLRQTSLLLPHRKNLSTVAVSNTVRIDVMDQPGEFMFESGRASLTRAGENAIESLAEILAGGTWPLTIEGHTDAFPARDADMDNWTLSLMRADAARRHLVASGLSATRIEGVLGLADTQPLRAEEPHLAANRRVTLILQVAE